MNNTQKEFKGITIRRILKNFSGDGMFSSTEKEFFVEKKNLDKFNKKVSVDNAETELYHNSELKSTPEFMDGIFPSEKGQQYLDQQFEDNFEFVDFKIVDETPDGNWVSVGNFIPQGRHVIAK